MKKKIIALLVVIALTLGVVLALNKTKPATDVDSGSKQVTITITDLTSENKEPLLNKTYSTDAENLYELLKENAEELKLDASESAEYVSVNGLMDLVTEDWNTGPWWVYDSENSECCKLQGFCPSVDQCIIKDGDVYSFTFMTY